MTTKLIEIDGATYPWTVEQQTALNVLKLVCKLWGETSLGPWLNVISAVLALYHPYKGLTRALPFPLLVSVSMLMGQRF